MRRLILVHHQNLGNPIQSRDIRAQKPLVPHGATTAPFTPQPTPQSLCLAAKEANTRDLLGFHRGVVHSPGIDSTNLCQSFGKANISGHIKLNEQPLSNLSPPESECKCRIIGKSLCTQLSEMRLEQGKWVLKKIMPTLFYYSSLCSSSNNDLHQTFP